nr:Uncharacterised protein [Klebsiella pneumoniae]
MIQRGKKIVPWNSLSPGLTIRLTSVPVGSVRRFCRYFPHPHNVRFLIFHPAIADDAAVNTVVEGAAILT